MTPRDVERWIVLPAFAWGALGIVGAFTLFRNTYYSIVLAAGGILLSYYAFLFVADGSASQIAPMVNSAARRRSDSAVNLGTRLSSTTRGCKTVFVGYSSSKTKPRRGTFGRRKVAGSQSSSMTGDECYGDQHNVRPAGTDS